MSDRTQTPMDILRRLAAQDPEKAVLIEPGKACLTRAALVALSDETLHWLNSRGLGRGDRILLIVENAADAMAAYLATCTGVTVAPVNPETTEAELDRIIAQVQPKAVVISAGLARLQAHLAGTALEVITHHPTDGGATGQFHLSGGRLGQADHPGPAQPDDIMAILLSSGTTGMPKAVPLTHRLVVLRKHANAPILAIDEADVCLNFRPPYLAGPLNTSLILPVLCGAVVVAPAAFSPDAVFDAIRDQGVTWFMTGKAYCDALLEPARARRDLLRASRLRFVRIGGYHTPLPMLRELEEVFGVPVIEAYSASEAGTICSNMPPPGERRLGRVGRSHVGKVEIRSETGAPLPAGEVGEIWVRSPLLVEGYFNDPERTAQAFVDGAYRTGDLGEVDADGWLAVRGRVSEVINRGGQKVSPDEVEQALAAHPTVARCIVFGAPHATLGQMVAAAVVAHPGMQIDERELRDFLRGQLTAHKVPVRIVAWADIPTTRVGKPRRAEASARFVASRPAAPEAPSASLTGSPTEVALAAIWASVLDRPVTDPHADFFELGGDSLRGAALMAAVEGAMGVVLPFETLFGAGSTVSGMAAEITRLRSTAKDAPVIDRSPQVPPTGLMRLSDRLRHGLNRLRGRPQFRGIPLTRSGDIDDTIHRMRLSALNWPGVDVGVRLPVFHLNREGRLPPLFWCFNGASEPAGLAPALGPDQPLFALRSLNQLMAERDEREALTVHFARLFADEVARLQPEGTITFGGNCQSSRIAEKVARHLVAQGREVALLMLEGQPSAPYGGRVMMFFGDESPKFNPFLQGLDPVPGWRADHRDPVWDVVPGRHGRYFRPPNVSPFAQRIKVRLAETHARSDPPRTAIPARQGA